MTEISKSRLKRLVGVLLLAFAIGLVVGQCRFQQPETSPSTFRVPQSTSTALMAATLATLVSRDEQSAFRAGPTDHALFRAVSHLRYGLTGEAVHMLKQLIHSDDLSTATAARRYLAIALLRQHEELNCLGRESTDVCIFPAPSSVDLATNAPGTEAVALLTDMLRDAPDDRELIWLLNVSAHGIGNPGLVPEKWRIGPDRYQSRKNIVDFADRGPETGSDALGLSGGVVLDDLDGDGDLDLMTSSWDLSAQLEYRENVGGRFVDRTAASGLVGITGGLNLIAADYDNDGLLDVLVLRGAWRSTRGGIPNSLLRNEGGGRFSDVTDQVGLLRYHPTQAAAFADFDNDGWVDLIIANESDRSVINPIELYRNVEGRFVSMADESGVDQVGFFKGVAVGDMDGDGRIDLYLSNMGGANHLLRNTSEPGRIRFVDTTQSAEVAEPVFSFASWFFDPDNDGDLDLFVAGYPDDFMYKPGATALAEYLAEGSPAETSRLYLNNGDGTFEDHTQGSGLDRPLYIMGANYGDLDNDGRVDIYLGTGAPSFAAIMPNRMFMGSEGGGFHDVTTSGGFGHLQKGHGIAFGDFDEDGDQDVYAVMGGAYPADTYYNAMYLNPGFDNHWIKLTLRGVRSNASSIGARVRFRNADSDDAAWIYSEIGRGRAFGAGPLRAEVGLGSQFTQVHPEVLWPGETRWQEFPVVAANASYCLTQGEPALSLCSASNH